MHNFYSHTQQDLQGINSSFQDVHLDIKSYLISPEITLSSTKLSDLQTGFVVTLIIS